jgi:hypothetical protein
MDICLLTSLSRHAVPRCGALATESTWWGEANLSPYPKAAWMLSAGQAQKRWANGVDLLYGWAVSCSARLAKTSSLKAMTGMSCQLDSVGMWGFMYVYTSVVYYGVA